MGSEEFRDMRRDKVMRKSIILLLGFLTMGSLVWAQGDQFSDSYVGLVGKVVTSNVTRQGFNRPSMTIELIEYPGLIFDVTETIGADADNPGAMAFPKVEKNWRVKLTCLKSTQLVQRVDVIDSAPGRADSDDQKNKALSQLKDGEGTFVGQVELMGIDPFASSDSKRTLLALSKNEGHMFSIPTDANAEALSALSDKVKIEVNGKYASTNSYFGRVYDVLSFKILKGSDHVGKEYTIQYPITAPVEKPAIASGPEILPDAENAPPTDLVQYDKPPTAIKRVQPVYPKFAAKANLQGKVLALLWVDKSGMVREVRILRSDSDIFNQAVIDAAKQYVFTPATFQNEPVAVWIAMPFSFSLK
jgi:TonB family protein